MFLKFSPPSDYDWCLVLSDCQVCTKWGFLKSFLQCPPPPPPLPPPPFVIEYRRLLISMCSDTFSCFQDKACRDADKITKHLEHGGREQESWCSISPVEEHGWVLYTPYQHIPYVLICMSRIHVGSLCISHTGWESNSLVNTEAPADITNLLPSADTVISVAACIKYLSTAFSCVTFLQAEFSNDAHTATNSLVCDHSFETLVSNVLRCSQTH